MLSATATVTPLANSAKAGSMGSPAPPVEAFELDEITIAGLQEGMKSGRLTARSIADKYLERIEAVDRNGPKVHSIIELNPDALPISPLNPRPCIRCNQTRDLASWD